MEGEAGRVREERRVAPFVLWAIRAAHIRDRAARINWPAQCTNPAGEGKAAGTLREEVSRGLAEAAVFKTAGGRIG